MTIAGMRNRSIFLKTRFSALGSIDLASSPTKSIVGVAMVVASFEAFGSPVKAPIARSGDAVIVKNLSEFGVIG